MERLSEKVIQQVALEALNRYYTEKYQLDTPPFSKTECGISKGTKNEGRRADGLLAFRKDNQFFTVSMEAKSHKTIKALFPYTNWKHLDIFTGVIFAIGVAVLAISLWFLWGQFSWYWVAVISVFIMLALMVSIVFGLDLFEQRNLQLEIIDQVKYYPANDQWLAFSADAKELLNDRENIYNSLENRNNYKDLRKVVTRHGFGLIVVDKGTAQLIEFPKTRKGSFLSVYAKRDQIIQELEGSETT